MAGPFWICMHHEDDGDRGCCRFRELHIYGALCQDQVHLEPNQVGREFWEPSEVGPASTSGVEELVGEVVRAEPAEKSPKSHGQVARKTTPGNDDTRVPPTGLNPLAM